MSISMETRCGACDRWTDVREVSLPPFVVRGSIKFMRGFLCPDCMAEYEKEQDMLKETA